MLLIPWFIEEVVLVSFLSVTFLYNSSLASTASSGFEKSGDKAVFCKAIAFGVSCFGWFDFLFLKQFPIIDTNEVNTPRFSLSKKKLYLKFKNAKNIALLEFSQFLNSSTFITFSTIFF